MGAAEADQIEQAFLREQIADVVEASNCSNIGFSAWELDFIDSMALELAAFRIKLTQKQRECLTRIWEKI